MRRWGGLVLIVTGSARACFVPFANLDLAHFVTLFFDEIRPGTP
jgi:hypothetical protein